MVLSQEFRNHTPTDSPDSASRPERDASAYRASRLGTLLGAYPVDLSSIGQEIHASPKLESLVMTLASSLVLSTENPALTLEDAAIVLGRDRLRVFAYMWSLLPQIPEAAAFLDTLPPASPARTSANAQMSARAADEWTPESLYLVSFLRWLGLDSPAAANSLAQPPCVVAGMPRAEVAGLTDLLMRDFVSLIPMLDPALLLPRQKRGLGPDAALEGRGTAGKQQA